MTAEETLALWHSAAQLKGAAERLRHEAAKEPRMVDQAWLLQTADLLDRARNLREAKDAAVKARTCPDPFTVRLVPD